MKLVFSGLLISLFVRDDAWARNFSWPDSIQLTQSQNAALKSARESLNSSEAQEQASYGGFLPKVSADLKYQKSNRSQTGVLESTSEGYTAALTATQALFSGFSDAAKLAQAKANTASARAKLMQTASEVSYELKNAFESLSYTQSYIKLTEDILKRRKENLRLVELRFESGRENKGSVLLSNAYMHQAEYDDLQAANQNRVAQVKLRRVLGMEEPTEAAVAVGSIPLSTPSSARPDFSRLLNEVPAVKIALAEEDAAREAIRAARSGFFPTLSWSASLSRMGEDFFPDDQKRWTLGATLSVPLFDGGKDYYGSKSAAATWRSKAQSRISTSSTQLEKIEEAYSSLLESVAKLKMDESFREAALVRADVARNKYNNGLISFEDWDIIENDLISRQKSYLQSKRDRVIAEAAWEQAQGRGVIQ